MARPKKTAVATATVPAETPAKPDFDWSGIEDAVVATYTRNVTKPDVESTTPDVVKRSVWKSFNHNRALKAPEWMTIQLKSPEQASEFMKLAQRYGRHNDTPMTVRATIDPAHLSLVKFSARNKETRIKKNA